MGVIFGPTIWQETASIGYRPLGSAVAGGNLICRSGGVAWIVAPVSTEVNRSWYTRDDAVTTAEANAACGDWFVPTESQLLNPGWVCRNLWECFSFGTGNTRYWSSTEADGSTAYTRNSSNGCSFNYQKTHSGFCIRAFRCVTY